MKFFDLELVGLAAANIKYTKPSSGGKGCDITIYTNGDTLDTCGRNAEPGKKWKIFTADNDTCMNKYPTGKPIK